MNKRTRDAAARRLAVEEARTQMVTYGAPVDMDPVDFVLGEVRRAAGHVAFLEAKIRSLGDEDLIWGMTKLKRGGDDAGSTFEAKPNMWLVLYRDERKAGLEAARIALAAGYEERRVRVEEARGRQFGMALQAVLGSLSLTAAQESLLPTVIPEVFLKLDRGEL